MGHGETAEVGGHATGGQDHHLLPGLSSGTPTLQARLQVEHLYRKAVSQHDKTVGSTEQSVPTHPHADNLSQKPEI